VTDSQTDDYNAQVAGAASILGVSDEDVGAIGNVLDTLFNRRCIPELTADDAVPSFMVGTDPSICQTMDCPVADASACMDGGQNGTNGQNKTSGAVQVRTVFISVVAVAVPMIFF
jgi:hypothetical protein